MTAKESDSSVDPVVVKRYGLALSGVHMTNYVQHIDPSSTPQTEKADPAQVPNSAGGFTFALDKWKRLDRFLILGNEGGTYYAGERKLTVENTTCVQECLVENGLRVVSTVVEISEAGRAPKNDPAIFVLALAASHTDLAVKTAAYEAIPRVCRIGTHLFQFVDAVNTLRGWGRGLRRAVGTWYTGKTPDALAYQVVKYQQRGKWSHRDVLRLVHVKGKTSPLENTPDAWVLAQHNAIYRWITVGKDGLDAREVPRGKEPNRVVTGYHAVTSALPLLIAAFEELRSYPTTSVNDMTKVRLSTATIVAEVVKRIREHKLTHEMIPGEWKSRPEVWEALAEHMPLGALIRNLAKLTQVGVIAPFNRHATRIAAQLVNEEQLKKARIHPIAILSALKVYSQGHGEKGSLKWTPIPQIIEALDAAFYLSFQHIVPTGKNILLALDVSGSMSTGTIAGVPGLTPRVASAAMAMVTMRTEQNWHVLGFSGDLIPLKIGPRMRLDNVVNEISNIDFGTTDCALPMLWAAKCQVDVDAFVVLTDNETYAGVPHPHQALQRYRAARRPEAKLAVLGMTATGFSIADPKDAGQMDFIGMDSATPAVLADFIRGGPPKEPKTTREDAT